MAAPSKSFTVIADGSIDPDSPLTTGLMTNFRDNDIHVEEWLGLDFTAAQNHDHDGANSAVITRAALVFDQITNQSDAGGAGVRDVSTITVASADLPTNRDAMIIASGDLQAPAGGSFPALGFVRLLVDGVIKQNLPVRLASANVRELFALSEIVPLSTGSDRIIKVQTNATTNSFAANAVNLFSVLIT